MKRRGFFGALIALPTLLYGSKSKSRWNKDLSQAPVDKWVWVAYAHDWVALAKLCQDGVWEHPDRLVIHTVTHWMQLSIPESPVPPEERWPKSTKYLDARHL